ncbi:MAG: biotin--[acetyl-CoA-carboxylase] ligase [Myxococcales bacterium]|nr:biotin--[acetyl-CoA-carboxylase] ligase [Myxococcales bacterium]
MNAGSARVLDALRNAGEEPCSGQTLSRELGVSRAQIWKHVEALRGRGYRIQAGSGEGYRLVGTPDRLYPEQILPGLTTTWLGRTLHWFEEVDSTNRVALDLAREGAPHGTAIIAEGQSAGRGRLGRSFFSPPGTNLYTSIILRPEVSLEAAPAFILAAAVGVADAVAATLRDPSAVEIKWPNDVLLDGLKTSGILVELGAEATRVSHLVLGIGVNLNVERESFPSEFRSRATSLASHAGRGIDRIDFTRRLFACLEETLDVGEKSGFEGLRPRFEAYFRMVGRRVSVLAVDEQETEGRVKGIDHVGALLLVADDGETRRMLAGDVTLCRNSA